MPVGWLPQKMAMEDERLGVIVVDHGSRRAASNAQLHEVVAMFEKVSGLAIVEPAHMELASPSIAEAFAQCAARGAELVVVFPYFLAPGRHWNEDIPRLAAEAADAHSGVRHLVTAPLGLHDLMGEIMQQRIGVCLEHALGGAPACDSCEAEEGCKPR